MTEAEKYSTLIEKIPQVNEAGKNSMLKYHPETTVSGSFISLNDVSELPHEVKCKISGVDNPTTVTVKRCGKSVFSLDEKTVTSNKVWGSELVAKVRIPQGTYTVSCLFTQKGESVSRVSLSVRDADNVSTTISQANSSNVSGAMKCTFTVSEGMRGIALYLYSNNTAEKINTECLFENIQIELGKVATDYEPYNGQTLTPNADGTVEGMTSVSPFMNIFTDTEGANIEATYRKSKGMEVEKEQFYNNFKQGIINDSISFEWMKALGKTNTKSIIDGLSDTAMGQTLTLNLAGVNKAYETASGANDGATSATFAELVATKPNWTITLI
jgi:hypothetical protein